MNAIDRAFEACSREAVVDPRHDRRVVERQQFGACFCCGIPLSEHFDSRNYLLPCETALAAHLSRLSC